MVNIDAQDRHKILHRSRPDYFLLYAPGKPEIRNKSHALFAKMVLLCGDYGIALMRAENEEDVINKLNALLFPTCLSQLEITA